MENFWGGLTRGEVIFTIYEMMMGIGQSLTDGICEQRCVGSEAVGRVRSMLSSEKTLNAAAEAFKVLGHNGRLKVLEALDGQELCVCDLSEILGLSMSGTSSVTQR